MPDLRPEPRQTLGEEIANSVSHGVGLLAALGATPVLVAHAARHGAAAVVGASVFAATVVLQYATSTMYHALPRNRAKRVFRMIEHGAIYLLIAGTYTPFMLGVLRGPWGWTMLAVIWSLAVAGVALDSVTRLRHPIVSTSVYVAMGWFIVIAARPLWLHVPREGLALLVAGGVAYTAGVAFYAAKALRYGHFVWHLCVLAGTTCHTLAVLWYAA
ncbi:MAG TPA: hemolysin III family protein [Gemmatimonadales bacterium]|nr:hemolysin III family protein [Gemmatimonadales bacterium]